MPNVRTGKETNTKGISTNLKKNSADTEITSSETDSGWKSPSKLKQDVQTIIDIMGPPISPTFHYNTSSEADNEESVFSNSKLSSVGIKEKYNYNDDSEKTNEADIPSKDDSNMSNAADLNTTTVSATLEDLTDSKVNFPYVENFCGTNQYICPPPLMPANVCINSECFCPQVASILHGRGMNPAYAANCNKYDASQMGIGNIRKNYNSNHYLKASKQSRSPIVNWLKHMVSTSKSLESEDNNNPSEYYKMNVKKKRGDDNSPPRRVVFELVEGKPKNIENCNMVCDSNNWSPLKNQKNFKNEKLQTGKDLNSFCTKDFIEKNGKSRKPIERTTCCDSNGKTRVDVYYFDHGSFNHYQTTDAPPPVITGDIAEKTEKYTTRFWAEIFGSIHIGFSFVTSFILQFFRFLLYSICRPLTIGLIQLGSDYFIKPLLVTIFNGIIQPTLIFIYNIVASIRDICDPISEGVGYFLRELSVLVRAFRIVDISRDNCKCEAQCKCDKKAKKNKVVC